MTLREVIHSVSIILLCAEVHLSIGNKQQPNIVFILADDLGWNDVSFHGSRQIPTPNLDTLAYDGILLTNYYVQPICTPTRAALLTARYPIHTGMQHGVLVSSAPYGLALNETLLSQYLKQLDYSTHIVGKWHLGFFAKEYTPVFRGFDSHFGYYQGAEDYWTHIAGVALGCGDYYDHTYTNNAKHDPRQWGLDFRRNMKVDYTDFGQYSTELFSSEAERIIESHNTSKPLFLYLPHQAVHSGNPGTKHPLEAPWKYQKKFQHIKHPGRRMFAAMVSALDDAVGNVTKALHRRGMLNNTIIVFSTDNGGPAAGYDLNYASNWPLRGLKHTLWEGGTRGAGFIWSPLLEKSRYHATQMVHVVDWLPTLLSAAGYDMNKLPADLDGMDQWVVLSRQAQSYRTEFLYNIDPKEPSMAIRIHNMKLLVAHGTTAVFDGWYKPEQLTRTTNITDVGSADMDDPQWNLYNRLTVDTDAAKKLPDTAHDFQVESAPDEMFSSDLINILADIGRHNIRSSPALVNCSYRPANYSTNCKPAEKPCLFDIASDPCEYNNLADRMPDIVEKLLHRLHVYSRNMVPPRNKRPDPKGFPFYHNGVWVPWIKLEDGNE